MLLFTACSSADDVATDGLTPEEEAAIIAEANMNSEIPIRLGFGSQSNYSSITRAPLESDEHNLFSTPEGKYIGVFCLAQKPQVAVATPGPKAENLIDWNGTSTMLTYLLAQNQPAKVVKLEGASNTIGNVTTTEHVSDVQFMDPTTINAVNPADRLVKHYYYPYGNWYNYYFYGYYPWQSSGVTQGAKQVTVDYTLDGTQDIIWGKAIPTTSTPSANPTSDVDRGFNAKYFRDKQDALTGKNQLGDLPDFEFNHKLAQLRFYIKCTDIRYTTGSFTVDNFKLADLQLKDVPKTWTLNVADRTTPANEGKVTWKEGSGKVNIPIIDLTSDAAAFDGNAATYVPIPYSADGSAETLVGYAMIPTTDMMVDAINGGFTYENAPAAAELKKPYITLTLYIKGETWTSDAQQIQLPVTSQKFEAGKVYNIILNIPVPVEINARATLDQWDIVATTTDSDQNINMTIQ